MPKKSLPVNSQPEDPCLRIAGAGGVEKHSGPQIKAKLTGSPPPTCGDLRYASRVFAALRAADNFAIFMQ